MTNKYPANEREYCIVTELVGEQAARVMQLRRDTERACGLPADDTPPHVKVISFMADGERIPRVDAALQALASTLKEFREPVKPHPVAFLGKGATGAYSICLRRELQMKELHDMLRGMLAAVGCLSTWRDGGAFRADIIADVGDRERASAIRAFLATREVPFQWLLVRGVQLVWFLDLPSDVR